MRFLIDTDICSAHLKQKGAVSNRFLQYSGGLCVSVVPAGELSVWAVRRNAPPSRMQGLYKLLAETTVLDVTREVAERFGS